MFGQDDRNPNLWGDTPSQGDQRPDDQRSNGQPDQQGGEAGPIAEGEGAQTSSIRPQAEQSVQPEQTSYSEQSGQAPYSEQPEQVSRQEQPVQPEQTSYSEQPVQPDSQASSEQTPSGQAQTASDFKGYVDSSQQPGQSQSSSTQQTPPSDAPRQADAPTATSEQSWYAGQGTNGGGASYGTQGSGWGQPSYGSQTTYASPSAYGTQSRAGAADQQSTQQFSAAHQPSNGPAPTWQQPFAAVPTPINRRKRAKKGPGWLALLIAMVVTALVAGGGATLFAQHYADQQDDASAAEVAASNASQTSESTVPQVEATGDTPDWQAVADAVGPAVVTINVTTRSSEGVGSGVVYDQSGNIVTNYHVVSTAISESDGQITVTLADGSLYQASVVGYDQTTDLAVIKLENAPSDLTVARFGSSADVTVGQNVMAIGAPLGLSNTVTTGVISALDRPVEVSNSESEQQEIDPNDPFGQLERNQQGNAVSDSVITNAIQVDASINPGNSGGPLFDQTGAVIGINSSIASMSSSDSEAGSIGLGFAIPSDLVKNVADQLISTGTVNHAVLGVTIQDGTATVDGATRLGAEVASVTSGSAADEAGIKKGDVILSVGGKQVTGSKSLTGFIRTYQSGDTVELEVVGSDGTVQTITATLQTAAD